MSIWLIIVLALLFVSLFLLWCFSKSVRSSSEKLSPLLNLLSIMVALSVFVQLYITIDIFNETKKLDYEDKIKQFEARMTTLETELRGNLNVCKFILENQADVVRGSHLPQNYFYFPMLEGTLRLGEIVSKDLLGELYSAYHYMMLSQKIMDCTVNLEYLKVLVNPDDVILKQSRKQKKEQMGFLIKNTKLAQGFILSSLDKLPKFRKEYVTRLGSGK